MHLHKGAQNTYLINLNHINIKTKMCKNLKKFNKNMSKQLDSLKVYHKVEFWLIYHNFTSFLSGIKNSSKDQKNYRFWKNFEVTSNLKIH
jgi:accessory colonization factor AcfC